MVASTEQSCQQCSRTVGIGCLNDGMRSQRTSPFFKRWEVILEALSREGAKATHFAILRLHLAKGHLRLSDDWSRGERQGPRRPPSKFRARPSRRRPGLRAACCRPMPAALLRGSTGRLEEQRNERNERKDEWLFPRDVPAGGITRLIVIPRRHQRELGVPSRVQSLNFETSSAAASEFNFQGLPHSRDPIHGLMSLVSVVPSSSAGRATRTKEQREKEERGSPGSSQRTLKPFPKPRPMDTTLSRADRWNNSRR